MMETVELNQLESQIDHLVNTVTQLQQDNRTLKNQLSNVTSDRNRLATKMERAALQIKQLITELREAHA